MTGQSRKDRRDLVDGPMSTRMAIFYVEHPSALVRDFGNEDDRAAALTAVERALSTAGEDDPLAYEAWRGRQQRRTQAAVGAGEAARRIVAWRQSGESLPDLPPVPEPPDRDSTSEGRADGPHSRTEKFDG